MRAASAASSSSVRTAMAAGAVRSGDSAREAVTTTVSERTGSSGLLFVLGGLFLPGPLVLAERRLPGGRDGQTPAENARRDEGRRKDAQRTPRSGHPDPVGEPQEHWTRKASRKWSDGWLGERRETPVCQ